MRAYIIIRLPVSVHCAGGSCHCCSCRRFNQGSWGLVDANIVFILGFTAFRAADETSTVKILYLDRGLCIATRTLTKLFVKGVVTVSPQQKTYTHLSNAAQ